MGYMKNDFEQWLGLQKQKDGTYYKAKTIQNYSSSLRTHASKLNGLTLDSYDLFTISDINEFNHVFNIIINSDNFDKVNKSANMTFSSALKLYKRFLEEYKELSSEQEKSEPIYITSKKSISKIKAYISSKGFTYEDGLIENFWLSLKSKPFVILAGTSGTGKTRLVKLFAEAIGAEYRLVPVRPDWSDSSDLLGHYNLDNEYVPGEVLKFIIQAQNNPGKPHILCLDEMNLARVEYYLSDFLSIIETRDMNDGKIISEKLLQDNVYEDHANVMFPENLYLVGTVNMDETTFPFSKKVLDRANTIEFNTVDLMPAVNDFDDEVSPIETGNDFLKSEYLFLSQCLNEENREFIESVCSDLEAINRVLKANNAHVGYRVRDEIVFYMLNNRNADLLGRDDAMDNAIMQKILPRIQGSSAAVKDMLCELFKIFAGDFEGYQTQNNDTASGMFDKLSKGNTRYPKSAAKTAFMVRRFDEDGFTSYWL